RIVAGDHHRAKTHRMQALKAPANSFFDHIFEVDHAEHSSAVRDDQRSSTFTRNPFDRGIELWRNFATALLHELDYLVACALSDLAIPDVDATHPGDGGERNKRRTLVGQGPPAKVKLF